MLRITMLACFVGGLLTLLAGCAPSQAQKSYDLKQTGLLYHQYHDDHQQGPPGWDELIAYAQSTGGDSESLRRVRDAGYQMKWNVRFPEITAGLSNTILAEKPGGEMTLIMDGSVRYP